MLISRLPKEVQTIIWKFVFNSTLENLKKNTEYIASDFDDNSLQNNYMDKCRYYQYIRFNDKQWGLLIGCGKYETNFEKNFQFLKRHGKFFFVDKK